MAGWNWFGKKRVKWGLDLATERVLQVLQPGEPADLMYPLRSNVSKGVGKGFVGVYDRHIIMLTEPEPGVIHLSMNDTGERRQQKLTLEARSEAELITRIEAWRTPVYWWARRLLSVHRLQPGRTYRILQPFTDFYGSEFAAGRELTFVGKNFSPYQGGYTLSFQETAIYLHEEAQSQILWDFDLHFAELPG